MDHQGSRTLRRTACSRLAASLNPYSLSVKGAGRLAVEATEWSVWKVASLSLMLLFCPHLRNYSNRNPQWWARFPLPTNVTHPLNMLRRQESAVHSSSCQLPQNSSKKMAALLLVSPLKKLTLVVIDDVCLCVGVVCAMHHAFLEGIVAGCS